MGTGLGLSRRYPPIPLEVLRARLELSPNGLTWLSGPCAGCPAGSLWRDGYVWVSLMVDGSLRRLKRGRVVYALTHGRWPEGEIDHINRDRADDRPENLREATRAQNNQNRRGYRKASDLPRGVYRRGERYEAMIGVSGTRRSLGRYATPSEAEAAYEAARRVEYGAFA